MLKSHGPPGKDGRPLPLCRRNEGSVPEENRLNCMEPPLLSLSLSLSGAPAFEKEGNEMGPIRSPSSCCAGGGAVGGATVALDIADDTIPDGTTTGAPLGSGTRPSNSSRSLFCCTSSKGNKKSSWWGTRYLTSDTNDLIHRSNSSDWLLVNQSVALHSVTIWPPNVLSRAILTL